jgi:prophage regulatory protein
MNTYETEQKDKHYQCQRLLRLRDVMALVRLSKSQIYKLSADGRFPASIKLVEGGTSVAWLESEVQEWIEERVSKRSIEI